MNNNQIQNPKEEVPSTMEMNAKDILNDILMSEKNITNNYSVALNEMSNEALYQPLLEIFTETQNTQRDLFDLLFKKGWYPLEKADQNKIAQKYNEYSNMKQELERGS
ncbi:MAG: spore coat protein [Bacilli bacterium]|jgi:spore coat protein CotF|nr:spore coat protein [Bacilli bacterium]